MSSKKATWRYFPASLLMVIFICTACVKENPNLNNNFLENKYINSLPADLRIGKVSFDNLLQIYDALDFKQKGAALEHFLAQADLNEKENAEASYMLGRLYQQIIDSPQLAGLNNTTDKQIEKRLAKKALTLFDQAKNFAPLKDLSLWHLSEVAAICGEEKQVRQSLNTLLEENDADKAAVMYGLAQSYLRANEIEEATDRFHKIRANFPNTNWALGSGYYLGTLAYTQLEQSLRSSTNSNQNNNTQQISLSVLLKTLSSHYFEYLKVSPSGRFAKDILAKLETLTNNNQLVLKSNEQAIIASVFFVDRQYEQALDYWQKAGPDRYPYEISQCLIKQGEFRPAQQVFYKAIDKFPQDKRILTIANMLSIYLSKSESLALWQKLHSPKYAHQDVVLWNIAIRNKMPEALHYYQQLLNIYPTSAYAPEAQWWLIWQNFKLQKNKSLLSIISACNSAANKYNKTKLAPRFLFWAGKISEMANSKETAATYYQRASKLYPVNYYGQRAKARYLAILNGVNDNYFNPAANIAIGSIVQSWNWPKPNHAIEELKIKERISAYELICLKQYDETLSRYKNLPGIIIIWLQGKNNTPWLAINKATSLIANTNNNLLWQYAYPLLYNKQITADCGSFSNVDPLLMHALIREESRYDPNAISSATALGLCQIMPGTASGIARANGIDLSNNDQLFQPDLNIKLGVSYVSTALKTFNHDNLLAIASYNAGIGAVKSQLENGQCYDPDLFVENFPFRETRDYMRKVFSSYWSYRQIYGH